MTPQRFCMASRHQNRRYHLPTRVKKLTSRLRAGILVLLTSFVIITLPSFSQVTSSNSTLDSHAIVTYVEQLQTSPDWRDRSQAAQALGKSGTDERVVIVALVDAMADDDPVVQLRATLALIDIGSPAIPYLIATLKHPNANVQARAVVALQRIGIPALDSLNLALDDSNPVMVTNSLTVIEKIAAGLNSGASRADSATLNSAVEQFDRALGIYLRLTKAEDENSNTSEPGLLIPSALPEISGLQQATREIKTELRARFRNQVIQALLLILGIPLAGLLLIFWFKPELVLKLSNTLIQSRQNRTLLQEALSQVKTFFDKVQTSMQPLGLQSIRLDKLPGKLSAYSPLPVMVLLRQPLDSDIAELADFAQKLAGKRSPQIGILIYKETPDALFRMRMAEVRIRDRFIVIPIPFAAIEQTLLEPEGPASLLAQYADRYLPGADLFDDRNAIGDTLSFFGRSEILQRLEADLTRSQGIGLFGLRKSGKTSLLLQLGLVMRQHPVIHIDLQPYGGKEHYCVDLFNVILIRLQQFIKKEKPRAKLPSLLSNKSSATGLADQFNQQALQLLKELIQLGYEPPIICSLDEVERILPMSSDPKSKAEEFNTFFGALRTLSQDQRILSLLIADVHPDCNRISQWPQADVPTNPIFGFLKEYFVQPFEFSETQEMIVDISGLMGIEFEGGIVDAIHHQSGGHPFMARQLSSLLYQKCDNSNGQITLEMAHKYLNRSFTYSGVLKDYCGNNIWKDLEKRGFGAAIALFQLMACNQEVRSVFSETELIQALKGDFTESQCLDALLWLESVGLLCRDESHEVDNFEIQVPLLAQWVTMQMREEEVQQWQLI
jgi:hypothetical protein